MDATYPRKPNEHTGLQTSLPDPSRNSHQLRFVTAALSCNKLIQLSNRSFLVERHQRRRRDDIPYRRVRRCSFTRNQASQSREVHCRGCRGRVRPLRAVQVSPDCPQARARIGVVTHPRHSSRIHRKGSNRPFTHRSPGRIPQTANTLPPISSRSQTPYRSALSWIPKSDGETSRCKTTGHTHFLSKE